MLLEGVVKSVIRRIRSYLACVGLNMDTALQFTDIIAPSTSYSSRWIPGQRGRLRRIIALMARGRDQGQFSTRGDSGYHQRGVWPMGCLTNVGDSLRVESLCLELDHRSIWNNQPQDNEYGSKMGIIAKIFLPV